VKAALGDAVSHTVIRELGMVIRKWAPTLPKLPGPRIVRHQRGRHHSALIGAEAETLRLLVVTATQSQLGRRQLLYGLGAMGGAARDFSQGPENIVVLNVYRKLTRT
jgi:hypothetical protein